MGDIRSDQISMDYYPRELLGDIFLQLPIRTLVDSIGFVCKAWNYVIKDDEFVDLHYASQISNHRYAVIFQFGYKNPNYFLYDSFENLSEWPNSVKTFTPPIPEIIPSEHSCRGLILFFDKDRQPLFVCNPMSRSKVLLPSTDVVDSITWVTNGLGYEPTSKTYKVVRIRCLKDQTSTERRFNIDCTVCSIKTAGGRTVTSNWKYTGYLLSSVDFSVREGCTGVYSRGHLYWPIENSEQKILAFDLKSETLKTLKGPSCLHEWSPSFVLDVFRENLCTIVSSDTSGMDFMIWVMEETKEGELWRKQTVLPIEYRKFCLSVFQHKELKLLYTGLYMHSEVQQAPRFTVFIPSLVDINI